MVFIPFLSNSQTRIYIKVDKENMYVRYLIKSLGLYCPFFIAQSHDKTILIVLCDYPLRINI